MKDDDPVTRPKHVEMVYKLQKDVRETKLDDLNLRGLGEDLF